MKLTNFEEHTQAFFQTLDTDKNGEISREEYVIGAIKHPELFRSLGYCAPVQGVASSKDDFWEKMVDTAAEMFTSQSTMGEVVYFGHPALNVVLVVMTGLCTVLQATLPPSEAILTDTDQCLLNKATSVPAEIQTLGAVQGSTAEDTPDGWGGHADTAPLDDSAFAEQVEWGTPALDDSHTQTRVIEYGPAVFRRIRSLLRIDVRQLLEALGIQQPLGNPLMGWTSEGKSGSFFFKTHDSKYVLKTIGDDEFDILRMHLGSYWRHLEACPETLLSHFFGLFDIWAPSMLPGGEPVRLRLVLMNNVLYHPKLANMLDFTRFDLKGAKFLRATGKEPQHGNLLLDKDLDELGTRLQFGEMRQGFLKQLALDTKWLASCGLYDYSVLVGIYPLDSLHTGEQTVLPEDGKYRVIVAPNESVCYLLGVIDVLTEFSFARRLQQTVQTVCAEVSAAPPEEYAERLQSYIGSLVD